MRWIDEGMPSVTRAYLVDHPPMQRKAGGGGQAPLAGENVGEGAFRMTRWRVSQQEAEHAIGKLQKLVDVQEMARARQRRRRMSGKRDRKRK